MAALPYIQLYVADYLADTAHLSTIEHGAYLLLIFNYWQRGESFKAKDERTLNKRLASVARLTENEWENVKETLSEFFEITETEWKHRRVEIDLEAVNAKSTKASNAGKASAAQRSNKRSTDVQQTLNHTDTDTDKEYIKTSSSGDDADVVDEKIETQKSESAQRAEPLVCPYDKLVDVYHKHFPAGARLKVLNDSRKRALKARWLEASRLDVAPFGYQTQADGLRAWASFFDVCADSDFLTGRVQVSGRAPFLADLDFFMQPSSFAKCLENKYHRDLTA